MDCFSVVNRADVAEVLLYEDIAAMLTPEQLITTLSLGNPCALKKLKSASLRFFDKAKL